MLDKFVDLAHILTDRSLYRFQIVYNFIEFGRKSDVQLFLFIRIRFDFFLYFYHTRYSCDILHEALSIFDSIVYRLLDELVELHVYLYLC